MSVGNNSTYGELLTTSVDEMLKNITPLKEESVFLDIGSGKGHIVSRMADVPSVSRAIGVELIKKRHKRALEIYGGKDKVELYCGDILKMDKYIKEADIVFMNSLTWPTKVMDDIYPRIKSGAYIIHNNAWFSGKERFKLVQLATSWYKRSTWYISKKK
mgnify:CR=1 FL=1